MRSLRTILDESNPNKLASATQLARLGTLLSLAPRFVRGAVVNDVLELPENARASRVLKAYSVAGATTGELTPIVGPAPATTQVGITDDGNIAFEPVTDQVTEAEVQYVPLEGEVIEEVVDVVSDVAAPLAQRKALLLLEVEALAGSATGVFAVEARGTTPGAGEAAVTDDGDIEFAAADAVTQARVKYVATPGVGATKDPVGSALDVADQEF